MRYFWKEGTSRKKYAEIEHWGFPANFVLGFKKIPFTLYTYVLTKLLQNGAKFIQKVNHVSKITWEILATSDRHLKV